LHFRSRVKFSQILLGTRAEKPAKVSLAGGGTADVLLRPLDATEELAVLSSARLEAEAKGHKDPKDGDAIYDSLLAAHTLAVTALDPDSPPEARERFFDKGAAQVGALDPDTIAVLYEEQRVWQEECSPSIRAKSAGELVVLTKQIAAADGHGFFLRLSPLTRASWARFSARLLVDSPGQSSLFGSPSAGSGTPPPTASAKPPPARRKAGAPA
jgi:hypothetical protein